MGLPGESWLRRADRCLVAQNWHHQWPVTAAGHRPWATSRKLSQRSRHEGPGPRFAHVQRPRGAGVRRTLPLDRVHCPQDPREGLAQGALGRLLGLTLALAVIDIVVVVLEVGARLLPGVLADVATGRPASQVALDEVDAAVPGPLASGPARPATAPPGSRTRCWRRGSRSAWRRTSWRPDRRRAGRAAIRTGRKAPGVLGAARSWGRPPSTRR